MKYQGEQNSINENKDKYVRDFHEPPNHRLDDPNITLSQSPLFHIQSMNVG